jgi:hypothetical protein
MLVRVTNDKAFPVKCDFPEFPVLISLHLGCLAEYSKHLSLEGPFNSNPLKQLNEYVSSFVSLIT